MASTQTTTWAMAGDIRDPARCWCEEGAWQLCFRTPRFGLVRCTACGCYRIDPPAVQSDQGAQSFYTEYYKQFRAPAPTAVGKRGNRSDGRFWRVTRKVPGLRIVRQSVADIGCGNGDLCAELRQEGWPSVVGLDVSRTRIARARSQYPGIAFYDQPLDETEIRPQSLDLIVMDNVVEHLPNPLAMLQQMRSYASREGRLLLITPNMESGCFRLLGRRWTPELCPHAHIYLFTDSALRQVVSRAGFQVEQSGTIQDLPFSWGSWLRRLCQGDLKGAVWSAGQQAGSFYSRLIDSGPMLFVVGRAVATDRAGPAASGSPEPERRRGPAAGASSFN